jgi:hypothetical protein
MGIGSVGHRLTILKSVYEIKIKQDVRIESDHYVPLCKFELYLMLLEMPLRSIDADFSKLPMQKHSMPQRRSRISDN